VLQNSDDLKQHSTEQDRPPPDPVQRSRMTTRARWRSAEFKLGGYVDALEANDSTSSATRSRFVVRLTGERPSGGCAATSSSSSGLTGWKSSAPAVEGLRVLESIEAAPVGDLAGAG